MDCWQTEVQYNEITNFIHKQSKQCKFIYYLFEICCDEGITSEQLLNSLVIKGIGDAVEQHMGMW